MKSDGIVVSFVFSGQKHGIFPIPITNTPLGATSFFVILQHRTTHSVFLCPYCLFRPSRPTKQTIIMGDGNQPVGQRQIEITLKEIRRYLIMTGNRSESNHLFV
jgi:hypothetical protein